MSLWKQIFSREVADQPLPRPDRSSLEGWVENNKGSTTIKSRFIIEPQFAARWNATASAAYPNEIGALVRIIERDGAHVAIDFRVLEQEVTPSYFEFTTMGQAQFQMEMATSGRGQELAEWYGMIHSHPNMTPFMSSTDVSNLWKLAGNKIGFSLICAARQDPEHNYYSVNYAQGGPIQLMVKDIDHNRHDLGGIAGLSAEQLEAIESEVAALAQPRHRVWRGPAYISAPSPNRNLPDNPESWSDTLFEDRLFLRPATEQKIDAPQDSVDPGPLNDSDLNLILEALELYELESYSPSGETFEIFSRIEDRQGLSSNQADILLSALGEFPANQSEEATVQKIIDQVSASLDDLEFR